jgi:squalene-hopene/tetraprenyl-beta-curcumene cyclase
VVSYALPALIAIGQVRHYFDPSQNAIVHFVRRAAAKKTLRLLESIQPVNGGFLEAAPLTGFVTMSLAAMGLKTHPVVRKGVRFLVDTVRADGSWPIDTNLSTWVTSLAINAMLKNEPEALPEAERERLAQWYVGHQFKQVHPYTGASPGGWAWNPLPGAVPDADDTAGALIALYRLDIRDAGVDEAVRLGLRWLLDLQNSDGGIPTFCRGWGRLEFDRSCPDITAHAILAWRLWQMRIDGPLHGRLQTGIARAMKYLARSQQPDGSWRPLWFGTPFSSDHGNPLYGTARVLRGIEGAGGLEWTDMAARGIRWIVDSQNPDGGWGARPGASSTCEETALAVEALSIYHGINVQINHVAVKEGLQWLAEHARDAAGLSASPMGLYFAKLWYAEQLYPPVFVLSALKCMLA